MSGRAINRVLIVPGGAGGTGGNTGSISAGTTNATLGEVVFADSNGVTFGVDGQTVTASVGAAGSVNFSAGTASADLDAVVFSNSPGVSFGLNGSTITATVQTNYLTTAMASNRGSDFVQATAVFNGTNASGTIASNAISVSVGNYITTAMASNRGSDFVQATAVFNGTNASGTIASNAISVSVGNYLTSQSNQAASASNGSFTFQTLGFSNANNVTFGTSAGSIVTASVAAAGGANTVSHFWNPARGFGQALNAAWAQGVAKFMPLEHVGPAIVSAARGAISVSLSTSSNSSFAVDLSLGVGLYRKTNSTLSVVTKGTTVHQFTITGNSDIASWSAWRLYSVPFPATVERSDYWIGVWGATATTNANWATFSSNVISELNIPIQGIAGAAADVSNQSMLGWGSFSVSSNALNDTYAFSDLLGTGAANRSMWPVYFYNFTA